jgi:biopolymer transport protein ExbB/TolQ
MNNELLMAVAASITAFGVLIAAMVAVYRIAKRVDDALGIDKDGRSVADRLERVEHQLWENGGSSLADRVNNIENHVIKVSSQLDIIRDLTINLQKVQTREMKIVENLERPAPRTRRKKSS